MSKFVKYISFILLITACFPLFGQIDRQQAYEEEIIRYLGYEEVPVRYLSLPYDVTMSHNVERNFMDIGFMLLMFVPLIFLWKAKRKTTRLVIMLLLALMCLLSVGSSHVLSHQGGKIFNNSDMMSQHIGTLDNSPVRKAVAMFYDVCGKIYEPIGNAIAKINQNGDHMTYGLLLAILYILYLVYVKNSQRVSGDFLLGILLLFYCFFMLILSAGIIWYGFLMFPLLYLEISRYTSESTRYRNFFLGSAFIFIILSYFLKVSNSNFLNVKGMGMLEPPVLSYNFTDVDGNEFYEGYFANIGPALDKINDDSDALVFQAGTSISYLINRNNERVFKDGILHIFSQMVDKYKTKSLVTEAFRASGFKYILVSPNIHIMDQTPEKSLTSKFQKMLGYLHQNKHIKLLATDRRVQVKDNNGKEVVKFDFAFGNDVNVIQNGTYAIYEIR